MESFLSPNIKNFEQNYQTHLKRLKLNGMQPKTIEAYSLAVRRAGVYFGLLSSHSKSLRRLLRLLRNK